MEDDPAIHDTGDAVMVGGAFSEEARGSHGDEHAAVPRRFQQINRLALYLFVDGKGAIR
jgi:hypothetical protein